MRANEQEQVHKQTSAQGEGTAAGTGVGMTCGMGRVTRACLSYHDMGVVDAM